MPPKKGITEFQAMKQAGQKITWLTEYIEDAHAGRFREIRG